MSGDFILYVLYDECDARRRGEVRKSLYTCRINVNHGTASRWISDFARFCLCWHMGDDHRRIVTPICVKDQSLRCPRLPKPLACRTTIKNHYGEQWLSLETSPPHKESAKGQSRFLFLVLQTPPVQLLNNTRCQFHERRHASPRRWGKLA